MRGLGRLPGGRGAAGAARLPADRGAGRRTGQRGGRRGRRVAGLRAARAAAVAARGGEAAAGAGRGPLPRADPRCSSSTRRRCCCCRPDDRAQVLWDRSLDYNTEYRKINMLSPLRAAARPSHYPARAPLPPAAPAPTGARREAQAPFQLFFAATTACVLLLLRDGGWFESPLAYRCVCQLNVLRLLAGL